MVEAHFIFPTEEDVRIFKKYDGYAVTCPDATVNVIAGIMQTGALSDRDVKIGMGSDIAGGSNLGIYTQISRTVQLSKIKTFYEPEGNRSVSFAEAFFMATKQGGPLFGKVGSFEKGYIFDALVIGGMSDPFTALSPAQLLERFCYFGETANIRERFLSGKRISASLI